jgi:hypothetical protein
LVVPLLGREAPTAVQATGELQETAAKEL